MSSYDDRTNPTSRRGRLGVESRRPGRGHLDCEEVKHAYLGIASSSASTSSAGAALTSVTSGGPAAAAGLRAGDIVTSIAGTTVKNPNDLVAVVADHDPGDKVKVTVKRGSSTVESTVMLGTQPAQSGSAG